MSRIALRRTRVALRAAGFTLIEVMAVLAIMSLIMVGLYTTLDTTLDTRELLAREARAARLGPTILDMVEADLRRVWILGIEEDNVFKGETRNLLGEAADQLVMLSAVDTTLTRRVEDSELTADVCETGYKLRINPELPDVLELWRRQQFHVDEEPLEGGVYERLHDRVVSFRLQYYEDNERETEPEDEWDASELHKLPAMVEVELGLEVIPRTGDEDRAERESRVRWYRRLIPLQRNSQLAMRVRPIVPAFQGTAAGGGGGGGGGGLDGGGGGGGPGGAGGPGGGGGDGDDPFAGGGPGGMGGMGSGGGPGSGPGGGGMGGGLGGGGDLGSPPDPGDVDIDPDPADDIDIEDLLDDIFGGG